MRRKNDHNENVGKWIYSKTLQDSLSKSSLITKTGISKCSLNVDVQVNDFGTEKSSKIRELSFWPKKQATVRLELTSKTQRVPKVGIKVSNSYETVMKHAMSKKAGDDGFALSTHTMYTFKLKTKDGFKLGDINKGFLGRTTSITIQSIGESVWCDNIIFRGHISNPYRLVPYEKLQDPSQWHIHNALKNMNEMSSFQQKIQANALSIDDKNDTSVETTKWKVLGKNFRAQTKYGLEQHLSPRVYNVDLAKWEIATMR